MLDEKDESRQEGKESVYVMSVMRKYQGAAQVRRRSRKQESAVPYEVPSSLSRKAVKFLEAVWQRGGGVIEESKLIRQSGLSHGSICAARRELIAAGLLQLGKVGRKTSFVLVTPPAGTPPAEMPSAETMQAETPPGSLAEGQKAFDADEEAADRSGGRGSRAEAAPASASAQENQGETVGISVSSQQRKAEAFASFRPGMPRVVGGFADFDDWTDNLMNELGDCLDISQSLVDAELYTVFSHRYGQEDCYTVQETEAGIVVE